MPRPGRPTVGPLVDLHDPRSHGKKLARELESARADFFLPLHWEKCERQDRGRIRLVDRYSALFPNYVFLNGDDARDVAARSPAKCVIYPVSLKTQPILQRELESLCLALSVDPWLGIGPAFREGDRVRVKAGPLMGVEGILESRADGHRVHLNVCMMGRSVPVEVPEEFLGDPLFAS